MEPEAPKGRNTTMPNKYLTVTSPGRRLPGIDNCISCVVGIGSRKTHTRQCAVCLRTFTGLAIFAANEVNYRAHPDDVDRPGTFTYARCSDCRNASRKLPDDLVPADAATPFADLGHPGR
jgi:hypothetical protein